MSNDLTPPFVPPILKKHVAMIHVSGTPTFVQKKAANVLHLHAYHELGDPNITHHEIEIKSLAKKIGFDSKDWAALFNSLKGMVNVVISWDMTGEGGGRIQGALAYLSQLELDHGSGTCRYAYPPAMRAWLHRPDVYAQINLDVQRAFSSRYALALYENCVRYKANNDNHSARQYRRVTDNSTPAITGWKAVGWWKRVLGVAKEDYAQFRYFRRNVLNPAIEEVSTLSDIRLEMRLRRKNRRITDLLFVIRPNTTPTLFTPECFLPPPQPQPLRLAVGQPVDVEIALTERMRKYGIAKHTHGELLALEKTDPGRIERNLSLLERGIAEASATISNHAAWVVAAIRGNYAATMEPEIVREVKATKEQARFDALQAQRADDDEFQRRVDAWARGKELFESWPEDQQRQFDRAIEASLAAQVDETGEPILPTIPFLRRTMVRVQRGAELERMMRQQET